ncbi:MAG: hypothetical protein LPK88_11175 [Alphaproteobacteria bacterium]|nr:hypothetical protein [Alphaproteobacteria bacterium]MDX5416859.1 hypothetical protein [Alphaproteobacteria bacterium]MDX5494254.1 hypothetical protein [Alphaproteobacteria bacterium]
MVVTFLHEMTARRRKLRRQKTQTVPAYVPPDTYEIDFCCPHRRKRANARSGPHPITPSKNGKAAKLRDAAEGQTASRMQILLRPLSEGTLTKHSLCRNREHGKFTNIQWIRRLQRLSRADAAA